MNNNNRNAPSTDFFYRNFLKRIRIMTGYYNIRGGLVDSWGKQSAVYYFERPFKIDTKFKRKFKRYYYKSKGAKNNAYYRYDIFEDTNRIYKACVSLIK